MLQGINILGTGTYVPERIVTNDDFSKIVETSDEWITTRTGISKRHISGGEPTWYMAVNSGRQAIENSGIDVSEIGMIVCASVSPDYAFPSLSCIVQRELKAKNAFAIDVNCACAGFVYSIDIARRYVATGAVKYALIIGAENLSKFVNYSDRTTCVLFGDGSASCVIGASENICGSFLTADGNGAKFLSCALISPRNAFMPEQKTEIESGIPALENNYMHMDGKEVYKFATSAMPDAVVKACEDAGITVDDLDIIIPHQANIRIIQTSASRLGVSMDKFFVNIQNYGNTSSASIGIGLHEAISQNRIKKGDKVCLVGFGAGLTVAGLVFEY